MHGSIKCPSPEWLSQFLSGDLAPDEASELETHVSNCTPCHATLLELGSDDTFQQIAFEAFDCSRSAPENSGLSTGLEFAEEIDRKYMERVASAAKQWSPANPPQLEQDSPDSAEWSHARTAEVEQWFDTDDSENSLGLLGQFQIEKLLGCGSSGVVYLATDTVLNRKVALKILRPSLGKAARTRFLTEARATATMDHSNVVPIHQVGVEKGLAFIAMKWSEGETLAARLSSCNVIPADEVRTIGSQIAAGLAAAHDANLIHRDIKPANIWIEHGTGNVKILDFGLVRANDKDVSLTMTGMLAGTPSYMSPEQARGAKLDGRSDLFSLGCVLYRMLSGTLPFAGDNVLAMLQSVQKDTPSPPESVNHNVPKDLSALVMCLLQKSPDSRPPSATAVSMAFQSAPSQWAFKPSVQPCMRKNRGIIWLATAMACIFALGFASLFWPQIIRIATDQGELVIETNDPDVKIEVVSSGGDIRIVDLKTDQAIDIKSGEYELRPVSDKNSISIDRSKIVMKRGGKEIVSVTKLEKNAVAFDVNATVRSVESITENVRRKVPADLGHEHILAPGDVVGVFAPELFVVPKYNEDLWTPLMVNANHELICTEFELKGLSGQKVEALRFKIREALNQNPRRRGFPSSASIKVKLLRKCPVPSELPNDRSPVIPSAPTHSQQVAESLRYEKLFRSRLMENFGTRHPSVVDSGLKIEKLKSLLRDVEAAEDRIFANKQALLLQHRSKPKEWRAEISLQQEMTKLHQEIFEMTKARLVKDLNWILLSDRMPFGLDKDERTQFVKDRIDTVRERANEKTEEYSAERVALIKAGWRPNDARPTLLDSYTIRLIPAVLKNLESRSGRRLSRFNVNGGEVVDLRFTYVDEPWQKPYRKVKAPPVKTRPQTSPPMMSQTTGTSVRVRVVAETADRPIANAMVRLLRVDAMDSTEQLISELTTDEKGTVEPLNLVLDQPNKFYHQLLIKAEGFGSQRVPLIREIAAGEPAPDQQLDWEISMVKAQRLSGVIVNHAGEPVEGATIYDLFDADGNPIEGVTTAVTDSKGQFTIKDLSPFAGPGTKWLRVRHPDFGPQIVDVDRIPDEIELALDLPTHIQFQIIDGETREPVPNYKVAAQLKDKHMFKMLKRPGFRPGGWIVATSDKDGWVHFVAPSTGSYNISHLAGPDQKKYPKSIPLMSGIKGSVTLDPMELIPAATVTGVVFDEGGNPVPNVSVGWYGPDRPDSSAMIRSVKTNEVGAFKANVVPGFNRLYISDGRWRSKSLGVRDGETTTRVSEIKKQPETGLLIRKGSSLHLEFIAEPRAASLPHE